MSDFFDSATLCCIRHGAQACPSCLAYESNSRKLRAEEAERRETLNQREYQSALDRLRARAEAAEQRVKELESARPHMEAMAAELKQRPKPNETKRGPSGGQPSSARPATSRR